MKLKWGNTLWPIRTFPCENLEDMEKSCTFVVTNPTMRKSLGLRIGWGYS